MGRVGRGQGKSPRKGGQNETEEEKRMRVEELIANRLPMRGRRLCPQVPQKRPSLAHIIILPH